MYRRSFVLIALVSIAAAVLVSAMPPASALPPAHGTATCNMLAGGSGTVSPGLTPAGAAGGVKISFIDQLVGLPASGMCGGTVTSPAGTHVIAGTVQGSGFFVPVPASAHASSCANFASTDKVGTITMTIKWSTSGPPIAPTTVVYRNNTGTLSSSGGHDLITLTGASGTATKSGSFAFPPTGAPRTVKLLTTLPGPACGPGPWSSFTIHSGAVSM